MCSAQRVAHAVRAARTSKGLGATARPDDPHSKLEALRDDDWCSLVALVARQRGVAYAPAARVARPRRGGALG